MGASVFEKTGSDKVYFTAINKTYANLLLTLGAAKLAVATDKDAFVFMDDAGDPHKCLTDSSGSTNLVNKTIIYVDANGHATSDSEFFFDKAATEIRLPAPPFTLNFGNPATDGTIRLRIATTGLFVEIRESAAWRELFSAE